MEDFAVVNWQRPNKGRGGPVELANQVKVKGSESFFWFLDKPPEGWPAPAPRDSKLGLPLQID